MQKTKMKIAVMAIVLVGSAATALQAKASWKDYFDKNEIKAINNYIADQVSENSKAWKGVISAKQVDDGIAKRKVYTGTLPTSAVGADAKVLDHAEGGYSYWKKISADEVDVSNTPQIVAYGKVLDDDNHYSTDIASNLWEDRTSNLMFKDGQIWVMYGSDWNGPFVQELGEYKIVVSY